MAAALPYLRILHFDTSHPEPFLLMSWPSARPNSALPLTRLIPGEMDRRTELGRVASSSFCTVTRSLVDRRQSGPALNARSGICGRVLEVLSGAADFR